MEQVIQQVLETLIQVLLPLVLGYAVVAIRQWVSAGKAKLSREQLEFASIMAREIVQAAEQSGLSGAIAAAGQEKKEWAITQLDGLLNAQGIDLDLEALSALIESAVYEAFTQFKELPEGGEA